MRRGLGSVTIAAFVLLVLGMSTNWGSPFAPWYSPRHHLLEWTFLVAATYLFGTYVVVRSAERARLVRILYAQSALLVTALVVFTAYHVHHAAQPQPQVSDWDSLSFVTPFHEQLAVPGVLGLVLAPLIALVALRSERRERCSTL